MSLLSIIGIVYFCLQVYIIKVVIVPNFAQPECDKVDYKGDTVHCPAIPANVAAIVLGFIVGAIWLFISGVGIYLMWNLHIVKNLSF